MKYFDSDIGCKYTESAGKYVKHIKKYVDVNPSYYFFIKNDAFMKCDWLTWELLFDLGLSLEDAKIKMASKYYQKARLYFPCFNKIFDELIRNDFDELYAKELVNDINNNTTLDTIDKFIKTIYSIKIYKNTELNYFIKRGHSFVESERKLNIFFKAGSASTNNKRENDFVYNHEFLLSRKPGAFASSIANRLNNSSKMELDIKDLLIKNGHTNSSYHTPIIFKKYKYKHDKLNFCHDMYIDDKLIIEYNGRYWHKDFLHINKFSKNDYMQEIEKAYNVIDCLNRNKKYLILWEGDLDGTDAYMKFVEEVLLDDSGELFFSTRTYDVELYTQYKKEQQLELLYKEKYKNIVLKMSEQSKCLSRKVCAIAVKNDRIISTGINGTPPGFVNCDSYFKNLFDNEFIDKYESFSEWIKTEHFRNLHHEWSNVYETHAEMSLLGDLAKNKVSSQGCDIFLSLSPCDYCRKMLLSFGVKNVYFVTQYDKATIDNDILKKHGIYCEKI